MYIIQDQDYLLKLADRCAYAASPDQNGFTTPLAELLSSCANAIRLAAARPDQFLAWACETFTADVAMNPAERLMRFVEEAVELTTACSMPRETVEKIVERVYGRNIGNIKQEIAQCQVTLELLAKVLRVDLEAAANEEFQRVQEIPKEEWDRRHSAKVAVGIALSTTGNPNP